MIPIGPDMDYPVISLNETSPLDPEYHFVNSTSRQLVFIVGSGSLLDSSAVLFRKANTIADGANGNEPSDIVSIKASYRDAVPPKAVPIQSLSLAIAQKCNLGCTYCYAEQGTFGGKPDNMSSEVAKASVDRLFLSAPVGQPITLAFMGGEPLFNREVLHQTTVYAAENARLSGREIKFSITTNATLIRPEDVALFQQYYFTVTVSIDGIGGSNDKLRPYISGKGSFEDISEKYRSAGNIPRFT
jgi:sulfatase maturation enzyme AslB (radical SAM superfamily)